MVPTDTKRYSPASLAIDLGSYRRILGPGEPVWDVDIPSHWNQVVHPRTAEHRGRLVKRIGDGVLIEFASTQDAVRRAVDIQQAMSERNAKMPVRRRLGFRIGISVADLIGERGQTHDSDLYDAYRILSFSPVGGITVSQGVYSHAKSLPDLIFEGLGEQQLKGSIEIVRMHLYHVQLG